MDWIDEQLEKLMRRLERTDLKWSLILYIGIAVVSALLAAILTAQICSSWMEVLMMPYSQEEVIRGFDQEGNQVFFRREMGYHELPRSVTVGVAILQIVRMRWGGSAMQWIRCGYNWQRGREKYGSRWKNREG